MKTLITCTPFRTLNTSTEPYFLEPGEATVASNVDVSRSLQGFSTALGRTTFGSFTLPTGYSLGALVPFQAFYGANPVGVKTVYVYSASNAAGTASEVGFYDPVAKTKTVITGASPFTQAVQFGDSLWTNGGDKFQYSSQVSGTSSIGQIIRDLWQIQVPYAYSYQIAGTYATVGGNAPVDTYTYAVTLRRAQYMNSTVLRPPTGGTVTQYSIDQNSLQESSPVFSTTVTVASGQQPGITVPTSLGLTNLSYGTTPGGEPYYGCLYRSRNGNPTFIFVDYITNIAPTNDHNGQASIIDTNSDAAIANNAYLTMHHDPPPILGQVYPGGTSNNSNPASTQQAVAQLAFPYTNPTFITKHKSRMWAFTLYPVAALGAGGSTGVPLIQMQPQLWFSDYGTPWSFDAAQGVRLVGPEDTPGVVNATTTTAPWQPGLISDTPMNLATVGSQLVAFKSQSTWIVLGDSPSEFIVRRAFDIGCMATNSVTTAEGGVFWLAPQGVYFFDGGAPSYIGEPIRAEMESLPWATRQAAVGSYRDRTFYLSMDTRTFCYYTPTKSWYERPYGTQAAVSVPGNQNQLLFASSANSTVSIYTMEASPATDNGNPIVATWTTGVTDSGAPGTLKTYRYVQIVAPQQLGTVQVTLTLDATFATPQTFAWKWDTSKGNGAFVAGIPGNIQGYEAQLTITATTNPAATAPLTLRAALVLGDIQQGVTSTSLFDQSGALNGTLQS